MAVTVTGTNRGGTTERAGSQAESLGRRTGRSPQGGGGLQGGDGRRPGGDGDEALGGGLGHYRLGMWVALASVTMMFTALTSAYIVRSGMSNDWRPLEMPPLVLLSTALILGGSFTIELAKRALRGGETARYRMMLFLTLILGLGFVASQLSAWRQLVARGIFVSSNPHSSFFYVLTGLHGIHILGGIIGLNYLLLRARRAASPQRAEVARQSAATGAVALYWHFMDGLWVYLLLLLTFWR